MWQTKERKWNEARWLMEWNRGRFIVAEKANTQKYRGLFRDTLPQIKSDMSDMKVKNGEMSIRLEYAIVS